MTRWHKASQHTPPPMRLYLLILPKHFHKLGHSNNWPVKVILIQTTTDDFWNFVFHVLEYLCLIFFWLCVNDYPLSKTDIFPHLLELNLYRRQARDSGSLHYLFPWLEIQAALVLVYFLCSELEGKQGVSRLPSLFSSAWLPWNGLACQRLKAGNTEAGSFCQYVASFPVLQ